ncbi:hypothetical protein GCM10023329_30520 [Streptomyces sanyensis]|uniref:Uncharacterized protein n=1 Tax=Streptomyces sanyensis TaxID=568869 RepID=A0ABP9AEF1_9ACTN
MPEPGSGACPEVVSSPVPSPVSPSGRRVGSLMPWITSTGQRRCSSAVTLRLAYTPPHAAYRYRA